MRWIGLLVVLLLVGCASTDQQALPNYQPNVWPLTKNGIKSAKPVFGPVQPGFPGPHEPPRSNPNPNPNPNPSPSNPQPVEPRVQPSSEHAPVVANQRRSTFDGSVAEGGPYIRKALIDIMQANQVKSAVTGAYDSDVCNPAQKFVDELASSGTQGLHHNGLENRYAAIGNGAGEIVAMGPSLQSCYDSWLGSWKHAELMNQEYTRWCYTATKSTVNNLYYCIGLFARDPHQAQTY